MRLATSAIGTNQTSKLSADTSAFAGEADSELDTMSALLVNLVLSTANPAPWLVLIEKHLERHFQSFCYVPERNDGRIALT
jgi:hypothetical protein